ncbi:hypothetical protein PsYK624_133870 [Phanerochaete sordida]|uniref:Uncharacterized protein n=1 Tax=Phanerochaete sordida TaxID=48140 RepID=A0A9P3GPL7_9APHY|nr:hypothetical protein PsYK624_133870 [Phanerochaete sordida]
MLNLIRARVPALTLWTTLQAGMWGAVWFRWREPSEFHGQLKSAIPAGHIGRGRYLNDNLPTLRGMAHHTA